MKEELIKNILKEVSEDHVDGPIINRITNSILSIKATDSLKAELEEELDKEDPEKAIAKSIVDI